MVRFPSTLLRTRAEVGQRIPLPRLGSGLPSGTYHRSMSTTVIILSGGRSSRFGGVHKPAVEIGGRSVLSRMLAEVNAAIPDAAVWIAGPVEGLSGEEATGVGVVREEPEFAGPLAGIAAASAAASAVASAVAGEGASAAAGGETASGRGGPASDLSKPASDGSEPGLGVTVILAGDMPLLTAAHLHALIAACSSASRPATSIDRRDKLQFLCAAWPTALLRERLRDLEPVANLPVRLLFDGTDPVLVDADPDVIEDFDTQDDLGRIQARFDR